MRAAHTIGRVAVCTVIAGCGSATSTGVGGAPSATAPPPSPTASATAPASSASADATGSFSCSAQSGGAPGTAAQLTAVRVAHHDGFDRVTLEFAGAPGAPEFTVTPSASTRFLRDGSGASVTLEGGAALKVVVRDASGTDLSGHATYTGSLDLHPSLAGVREVTELGDFERVLDWGVGIATAACFRVTALSDPVRLAVDVQVAST